MREARSTTRRAAPYVLAMYLACGAAFTRGLPILEMPADTAANGATKLPMTMPARTEILALVTEWKLTHPGTES
ncbi:MAG TPA: hypothetical protein VHN14_17875 [Kofleriaceae bacterium]|jgi:hypothetical protein|nr:hypothetical protein [Kofleriaceae bacterium]